MPKTELNGQEFYYEDTGNRAPAVLFIHGFLTDHSIFQPQVDALSSKYRCVTMDCRASGATVWDGKPFSLYDTADDAIGILDHLGIDRAVFVGCGQGGYVAMRIALTYPHRVRALALMSTRNGLEDEAMSAVYADTRDTWLREGPADRMVDGILAAYIGQKETSGELWDEWHAKWKSYEGTAVAESVNHFLERDDIDDRLYQIRVPTLVTHGEMDFGIPLNMGKALSNALPKSRFKAISGAPHLAHLTHPAPVNEAIKRFLARMRW